MPRRKSVIDAAIKQLSPVLGSEAVVVVAALGLAVLVTEVLVTVVVVESAAAGLTSGRAAVPEPDSPAAGSALEAGSRPSLDTSRTSVSPVGFVAPSGSTTTCEATAPLASNTPLAPKTPPAGATKRADVSDPARQPTPPSAPVASSHEASTASDVDVH